MQDGNQSEHIVIQGWFTGRALVALHLNRRGLDELRMALDRAETEGKASVPDTEGWMLDIHYSHDSKGVPKGALNRGYYTCAAVAAVYLICSALIVLGILHTYHLVRGD